MSQTRNIPLHKDTLVWHAPQKIIRPKRHVVGMTQNATPPTKGTIMLPTNNVKLESVYVEMPWRSLSVYGSGDNKRNNKKTLQSMHYKLRTRDWTACVQRGSQQQRNGHQCHQYQYSYHSQNYSTRRPHTHGLWIRRACLIHTSQLKSQEL